MRIAFKGYLISPAGEEEMQKRLQDEINILNEKFPAASLAHIPKENIKFIMYPELNPILIVLDIKTWILICPKLCVM